MKMQEASQLGLIGAGELREKPANGELSDHLAPSLASSAATPAITSVKEFPPFSMDLVNQCLWRSGNTGNHKCILLTPKAFAVLRHLVERAGRLVSQGELLDAVWPDTHVQPAVLNNQILNIRTALGDTPKSPVFIETLPRRGYRFIAPVSHRITGSNTPHVDAHGGAPSGKLFGREKALDELRNAHRKALKDQRQIVFIAGEIGIGKTTLVDEFQRQVAAGIPGIRIARGQCVEGYGGKEPYYPMLEALGQLCRGAEGDSVTRILASQAPTWLAQFPALMKREHREMLQREILGATRERMLREIGDALETIASVNPLLLVFEDLHWVDPCTVDLLSALARRRGAAKLMMLGMYRPADLDSCNSPLNALTQDLLVRRLCHEIALEPLTEVETTEYLASRASGVTPPEPLAALLYRRSEGNPLFMVTVLEHLAERRVISWEQGHWYVGVSLREIDLGVPECLRKTIEAQIERLTTVEQRVLEAASLSGIGHTRFGVASRSAAIEMDPERFEETCEQLSRRHGILRPATPEKLTNGAISACYEFVHALYQEVCYRRIALGRRAKLCKRLDERVEANWALVDDARPLQG
jgi:DNA-binding winged helix-turn-helix (wHTH) protein